ncbi:MAG: MCE family protein [Spirochaetales bacterium]|nr:MCE family protein [Spirochaetales bacterium]
MEYRYSVQSRLAGLFLFTAIVFFFVALYNIAVEGRFFSREYRYFTQMERGDGISPRTRIEYKGLKAGAVSSITLEEGGQVRIDFFVYPEFNPHLKGFVYLKISSGNLIGGKSLELIPDGQGEVLAEGSKIPSETDQEVLSRAERGLLLVEPDSVGSNMEKILANVAAITQDMRQISRELGGTDANVTQTVQNLTAASSSLRHFAGTLQASTPEIRRTVRETQSTVESASKMVQIFTFGQSEEGKAYSIDTRDLE